ncbi:ubiquinone/menaquinone biosynthesis methyltransferase [Paenibacillus konkukensis]|uniref:Ubiquinone/menaquinone biosynthesis methyltransferase n=1 Tax=Paenibacillus konkukensis TaxID=2020716 RepID=A0ABY4REB9_9BACL|nr:class I SAM-dependent methyltransferase [Paenibacillus konkukensis]UQZ81039.1 ubiquinone/menaquinone biosynthesis methyltransferase [Paenibacillus konkukensis]
MNEFENKAKAYAAGRPTYPEEILSKIQELGIGKDSVIADIGAGTGLLTNLLCKLDCKIIAVEPDVQMLNECRQYCSAHKNIEYIHATAERTPLAEHSIDVITIASAFHWFDKELSKAEFKRILKKDGYVILLWNMMQKNSEFAKEYVKTLGKYTVKHTAGNANIDPDKEKLNFFGQGYSIQYYDNWQRFNQEGIIGNALSLSYTPSKLDMHYDEFVQELRNLFLKYQEGGEVTVHYQTEVCIAQFLQ